MKKFTLTLLASALAAGSASAYTLVDTLEQQEYGTKLDFIGSARLKWQSTSNKTTDARNGDVTREHINHAVSNNGSRFGFKLTQEVGAGFYGIGRVEWRFRGDAPSQHDFDHIYTRQLYGGIGHKQYGELTYGNQTVITDEVKQTDLPNTLSLSDGLLVSGARRSLQYVYNGIEGLKVGGFYGGGSPRGNDGLSLANHRKDVWGLAAIQKYEIDKDNEIAIGLGTTKERFQQNAASPYSRTAYAFGTAYTYDKTTIGLDWERRLTKDQAATGNKRNDKEIRTVLYHKLTSAWRIYGMYAYKTEERTYAANTTPSKEKANEFMVGTEYRLPMPASTSLRTFLEWKTARIKDYRNGELRDKTRENTTLIGLRYYW